MDTRPLSKTGAGLLLGVFPQRHGRGSILVTSNLPFDQWREAFGNQRLTGALLDRLTHHVHVLACNGDSYRLADARRRRAKPATQTHRRRLIVAAGFSSRPLRCQMA